MVQCLVIVFHFPFLSILSPQIDLTFFTLPYRITRAFMIEELNSIKQKAASADGAKKKGKKGKKSTKK